MENKTFMRLGKFLQDSNLALVIYSKSDTSIVYTLYIYRNTPSVDL